MDSQSDINAFVENFYESPGDHHVTYYTISVTYLPLARRWQVAHRYKEFDQLRSVLAQTYTDVPPLPPKSLWKRSGQVFLSNRKTQLDAFVREVVWRPELGRCRDVRDFLRVDEHAPETKIGWPEKRFEEEVGASLGRAEMGDRSLVAICGEISGRPSSPIKSLTKPLGYSLLYQRVGPSWDFKPVWRIPFRSAPTDMCWDPQLTLLAVGLESGLVIVYRIYTELNFAKYDQFSELPVHASAVRGLAFNYQNSYLYSVGEDCRLVVSDINRGTLIADVALREKPRRMQYVMEANRVYIAFAKKAVIFSTQFEEPVETASLVPEAQTTISSMIVVWQMSRLFAGTTSGVIHAFRLGMLECEQTSYEEKTLKWKDTVTSLSHSLSRSELYASNDQGIVSIWSLSTLSLLTVFRCDSQCVRTVLWSESERILVTSAQMSFCVYELPDTWTTVVKGAGSQLVANSWKVTDEDLAGWDR